MNTPRTEAQATGWPVQSVPAEFARSLEREVIALTEENARLRDKKPVFEVFCDRSYYDQWAVRRVGENRWGWCYHLPTKEEAERLAQELTALEPIKEVAANQ